MNIPAEFTNRVFKTRMSGMLTAGKQFTEIQNLAEGSEIDVIYEGGKSIIVLVFETQQDCLAFNLKYGDKYA